MSRPALALAFLSATLLAACCPKDPRPDVRPLPPPVPVTQQVIRLNDRALALNNLTMGGTVVIRYVDDKKGDQQQTADGRLLIRQDHEKNTGDVFISGRAFGQEVFRAGKNAREWFFVIYVDPKRAWVGEVNSAGHYPAHGAALRADTVLEVLGISQLGRDSHVGMLVRDDTRSNNLIEVRTSAGGPIAWLKREIIVNRDTGDIDQVNLYDFNGVPVVRAVLKKYKEIRYREGDEVPKDFKPPRFPFDIWIYYLPQKASIHFTVHDEEGKRAELRETLPDAPFEVPDLEGIKLERPD